MSTKNSRDWRVMLRNAGYDPKKARSADQPVEFEVPEDPTFRRDCKIGHPCDCLGAKAMMEIPGAVWTWLGAWAAIVVYKSGQIVHYTHDGIIPKDQDSLIMTPPGRYVLQVPSKRNRLGATKEPENSRSGNYTGTHKKRGRRLSIAAQLRH